MSRRRLRRMGRFQMDEPTPLKLLGAHLVRELEKLKALGSDGSGARAFHLKEVEVSIPFAAQSDAAPAPIVLGDEEPLTAVEAIARLDHLKTAAFVEVGRIADAPVDSIAVLRLRVKF